MVIFTKNSQNGKIGNFPTETRVFLEKMAVLTVSILVIKSGGFLAKRYVRSWTVSERSLAGHSWPVSGCGRPASRRGGPWGYPGVWVYGGSVDPWWCTVVRVRVWCLPCFNVFSLFYRVFPLFRDFPLFREFSTFPGFSHFSGFATVVLTPLFDTFLHFSFPSRIEQGDG